MVRLYVAGCFHKWEQLPGAWGAGAVALAPPAASRACRAAAQLRSVSSAENSNSCWCHRCSAADIARELLAAGCSMEELRGCVRHLVV